MNSINRKDLTRGRADHATVPLPQRTRSTNNQKYCTSRHYVHHNVHQSGKINIFFCALGPILLTFKLDPGQGEPACHQTIKARCLDIDKHTDRVLYLDH